MDLDVDIDSPQLKVSDAEDPHLVNTYSDELGYRWKTVNITLIPDNRFAYLELSMSTSELS